MSGENRVFSGSDLRWIKVILGLGLALTLASAAGADDACGLRIAGGVEIVGMAVVDADGEILPYQKPQLYGWDVILAGGTEMLSGVQIQAGDALAQGAITNTGAQAVVLYFADGSSATIGAGETVAVADEATCRCKCTCKDAAGNTKTALFDCDGNGDKCAYNGDACVWADDDGVHEGTYEGCKKVWVIRAVAAVE